ncbi:MAG: alpha/beta fold hydrolase, partial [Chloroflexi bacterium]|nr:alpha/beta fold hydrolase [Chloroflexota bacterium]
MEKRHAYLEQLRRILPPSEPWEAWLARTGELPPDFDALPSHADLPDLLTREDGQPVTSADEWRERREELKTRLQRWMLGQVPPPPGNLQAHILDERVEDEATVRQVQLAFGPGHRARLWLELLIPPGDGPFPVFMTQHNHRAWALIALRRGYLACVYAGSDSRDDTDTFAEAYPEYDWSRLTRRAWAASRCVDYLATVPQADIERIAITGHSRNGKQSLIAAALDERIAVVISSSSGAGGTMTTRHFSEQHFGEGIELLTRVFPDWFHPRLRFFVGREHKLPVDLHALVALSAPRPCLLSIALNDGVESTWAMQQTYLAVREVYRLLGVEGRLRILWRPGRHETWPTVIERYLDWCDTHFGRGEYAFPERFVHPWDWETWRQRNDDRVEPTSFPARGLDDVLIRENGAPVRTVAEWKARREEIRAQVRWMLGESPPRAGSPGGHYGEEPAHIAAMLGREDAGEGLEKAQIVFGEYINGDVYMPAGLSESGQRAPAILWLHPFSFASGYVASYRRGEQVFRTLARAGFVVFCFDQIGFGRRVEEAEGFYERHPRWSLLGKMVRDARAALDTLAQLPYVDPKQIWGLGYGLGALVGLHLGALNERLAGLISVCGPPPFRLDTDERRTGGIRR